MKSLFLKPYLYCAVFGMTVWSLPLHADSLTVEGDLNIEGSVGIGTDTPTEKLEVDGNVKVNGTLTTTGGIASGGTIVAPSITLPDGSALTSAKATTLYSASGQPAASVDAYGKVNFTSGISIGVDPAATITPASTAYLNQALANLGYRENSVAPTHVTAIPYSGQVTCNDIVQVGSYVYVCGTIYGTGSVGGVSIYPNHNPINSTTFVAKLDLAGNVQWLRSLSGDNSVALTALAVDGSGNVVVAGNFSGTTTGLSSPATNLVSAGSNDGIVVKYNAVGASQWAQRVGGTSGDFLTDVAVDGSGNVVVVGVFRGTTTGLSSPATNLVSAGEADGMVVKYNASGGCQWAQRFGGTGGDRFNSVAVDGNGNVVVAGYFSGTATGLSSPAADFVSAGLNDGIVIKYNAAGASQWAQRFGGTGNETVTAVAVDGSGDVVVAGHFTGTTTGLSSPAANLVSAGSYDGIVVKYNASGASQWAQRFGGAGVDYINSMDVDGNGNVVVAGYFSGTTTGLSSPATNLVSAGGVDGMVVKYNASGASQVAQRVSGTSGSDSISKISVQGDSIWILGSMDGATPLPVGDIRVIGSFAIGWSGLPITTLEVGSSVALAWGGSAATNNGVALGSSAYASEAGSAALGAAIATGKDSFAAGRARATGRAATAMGPSSTASGFGAVAMGPNSTASGDQSIALRGTASGAFATVIGGGTASGESATVIGWGTASGFNATVMGGGTASGHSAIAMGYGTTADGDYASAMGYFTTAQAYNSTVLGRYNVAQGNPDTWVLTDYLFVIGNGTSGESRSNAFTVRKNGETYVAGSLGIGTATPSEKLDIVGNANITGTLIVGGQPVATSDQLSNYLTSSGSGADLTDISAAAITATGTRDATTFLRGDNTWAVPPAGSVGGPSITDGDKGDITVSSNGDVWTVNSGPLDRANHTGTQPWSTLSDTPTTVAGYGITDAVTLGGAGQVTLPGSVTAEGDITVKGRSVIRVSPAGDIGMGLFNSGANPEL